MGLHELFLVVVRIHHDQVLLMEGGGTEGLTVPQGGNTGAETSRKSRAQTGRGAML